MEGLRLLCSALVACILVRVFPTAPVKAAEAPGSDLFERGRVRRLKIQLPPAAAAALRQNSRGYVRATLEEGNTRYENVGLHLKGAVGSFRPLDDKPAFTLDFDRFSPGQKFHQLRKVHLNNSVEDPSYLNEKLGSELFRAAGVPAPRVAHALVDLNGRPLGLYVLKEGFTKDFLALHFRNTDGNLYDTGAGHDVDEALERDSGSGPDDRADLQALTRAVREPDLGRRWAGLTRVLDVPRVISFMAMEVLCGHADGYCMARNNFRVYHDLDTDRILFFPHGMDRLFIRADLPWQPQMAGVVGRAVLEAPEGRLRYRARLEELLTNVFKVDVLAGRVDQWVAELRPALGGRASRALARQAEGLKGRMAERATRLSELLREPEPRLLPFDGGVARVLSWRALDTPPGGRMDEAQAPDGRRSLWIKAGPRTMASWRSRVLLARGRYRFLASVRTAGVEPLLFGKNKGAGVRLSGTEPLAPYHLAGDSPWQEQGVDFEVLEPTREVELVCELRAGKGEVWFDVNSLHLVRRE